MSAKGKRSDELKRLQERLTQNQRKKRGDDGELMADLLKNIQSQWLLGEWQELLRTEQKMLVGRMKLGCGTDVVKAREIRD